MRRALALLFALLLFVGCGTNVPLAPIFDTQESSRVPHRCQKTKAFVVGGIPVWRLPDGGPILFVSKMSVSADGAPNAYHPEDRGTDKLASGGVPGGRLRPKTERQVPDRFSRGVAILFPGTIFQRPPCSIPGTSDITRAVLWMRGACLTSLCRRIILPRRSWGTLESCIIRSPVA